MKALITGVTGCVGSHLADLLIRESWEVVGTCRWRSPRENIAHIPATALRLVECDLDDPWSVTAAVREVSPDVIFHVAAQSYVAASYRRPAGTLAATGIGTVNLLEAVRAAGIDPVIHVCSSSEVYGRVAKADCPIKETQPFSPLSPYALAKCLADNAASMYHQAYGLRTVRTRAFTHSGPRRGWPFFDSNFCRQVVRIERGIQRPVISVGNLESVRTVCDVRDMVRAYVALVNAVLAGRCAPGRVFNIGGAERYTVRAVLGTIQVIAKTHFDVVIDKSRLRTADADLQIPDTTAFSAVCPNWSADIPYLDTLAAMLSWWQSAPDHLLVDHEVGS